MASPLQVPIQLLDAFGAGIYALTLVTHAGLWWHRRDRPSHLWLAASAFGALLVNLSGAAIRAATQPVTPGLAALNMLGVAIALVSLYELAAAIGGRRPGRFARTMEAATLLPVALFVLLHRDELMQALYLLGVLFLLAAMARAARDSRSGDREARVLAFGLSVLFATLLYDVLSEMHVLARIEGVPVLGFTVLYVAAARALSLRYDREYRELVALRGELESRVQRRTLALEAANQRLDLLSRTDALTGLANRRSFVEAARARLATHAVALVMIDIDHFKRINDAHGHDAGDAALRAVAAALAGELRPGELLARWGGEEFIALLEPGDTRARAERMRRAVAAAPCVPALPLSASFGTTGLQQGDALEAAITRADRALYRAKREGRDRVVAAD